MRNRESLEKLFFELASESRLSILTELEGQPLKMQEIARRLDVTATEVFRQLERLSAAMLVQRQPDGSYAITSFGKLVLQLSSPLDFVSSHREYFSKHDMLRLPPQFISRIGELSSGTLVLNMMESLNKGQKMFIDAEEFGWGLAEGVVPELMGPVMEQKLFKGVKMRFIIPEKLLVGGINMKGMEIRGLSDVPLVIAVTEKAAALFLRTVDGRMDYVGLHGTDELFRAWVKDLFLFYWEKAKRL